MTLKQPETLFAGEFTIRPVTMDDLATTVDLMRVQQVENGEKPTETVEHLRSEWEDPKFDLGSSTMAAFTPEGRMIAYKEIWDVRETPVRPFMWGYVHPDYRGRGLGTYLSQWAFKRAEQVFERVPADARVVLEAGANDTDKNSQALLESIGMVYAERVFYKMKIKMTEAPPQPQWPEGVTIKTITELGDDITPAVRGIHEAFKDHRGSVDEPFETRLERITHHVKTDPKHDSNLWFVAMDGDNVAGVSLCRIESEDNPDEAYVATLGVVRDYRKRGLGLALLHHSFNIFWNLGKPVVSLHVDGASLTGATRLYERAGMTVAKTFMAYEKELRPGRELSKQ